MCRRVNFDVMSIYWYCIDVYNSWTIFFLHFLYFNFCDIRFVRETQAYKKKQAGGGDDGEEEEDGGGGGDEEGDGDGEENDDGDD